MTRNAVVGLLAAGLGWAQDAGVSRMDEIVQSFAAQNRFMGSVLVAKGDRALLDKGYGFANLEWRIANGPEVKHRLGSVTKQFTAACILLLEERGKLAVSDPVSKHVADAPAAWEKITLHHLLTHTSGIRNFTALPDYQSAKRAPMTPEKAYQRVRGEPLDFQPGEKFQYSNSNYLLLGYLVEKISGTSYENFLRENLLEKAGMKETGVDSSAILPKRAAGYTRTPQGLRNAEYVDMSVPHAAGALYSTTGDLLRWQRALYGGRLLTAGSLKKMTTPEKGGYAYGIGVAGGPRASYSHGGRIEGFNTSLAYYPESEITVAVLGNLNGGAPQEIAQKLAALAHGETVTLPSERKRIKIPVERLSAYAGVYELRPGFDLTVAVENGELMTQATGQRKIPIFAESETKFYATVMDAQIEFVRGGSGKVTHLVLTQGGRTIKGVRK